MYRGRAVRVLRGPIPWEISGYSAERASTQAVHRDSSTIYGCSLPPPDYGRGSKDRAVSIRPAATARRARPPPATPPGHEAAALGGPIAMATSGYSAAAAAPLSPLRRVLLTTCGNISLKVPSRLAVDSAARAHGRLPARRTSNRQKNSSHDASLLRPEMF